MNEFAFAAKMGAILDWEEVDYHVDELPCSSFGDPRWALRVEGKSFGRVHSFGFDVVVSRVALLDSEHRANIRHLSFQRARHQLYNAAVAYVAWKHRIISPEALKKHARDVAAIALPEEVPGGWRDDFAKRLEEGASFSDSEPEIKRLRAQLEAAKSQLAVARDAVGCVE